MKSELDDKKKDMENLTKENEQLNVNSLSFKTSNIHVNKSVSINETIKSL
jgi:hypothetical protein